MTGKGDETQDQPDYLSYLLRLWRVTLAGQVAWRASLECPHTGDRLGFADLHSLWSFLQSQMRLQEENAQAQSEEVG
jgi:hypothetical protein